MIALYPVYINILNSISSRLLVVSRPIKIQNTAGATAYSLDKVHNSKHITLRLDEW